MVYLNQKDKTNEKLLHGIIYKMVWNETFSILKKNIKSSLHTGYFMSPKMCKNKEKSNKEIGVQHTPCLKFQLNRTKFPAVKIQMSQLYP